jgi:murein DD-endopeptidase MepM/ murein hydrolase activator NlpD
MAVAVKPSKSLLNIRSGIKSIKNSFSGLRKNAGNLNDVVLKKTKVKRESIVRNAILSQRRQEQERRKNKEDLLEASTIGGAVKRQAKAVASSTKGFFGRIMDFLATLLVGWLLTNLPSIITMAQELIARIQRLYTIVTGFFDNTIKLFRGFGNLLGAVGKNILTFDFMDSKGRVESSLKDLGGTFEDMQSQFDEGFKLLTTSLGEGVVSGEDAAPFGTQYENESMQQQPAPSGGTSGSGGTKYPQLAQMVVKGEGGVNSVNRGNAGDTPGGAKSIFGKNLTEMTVGEIMQAQREDKVFAVGKYQFIPKTLSGAVSYTKIPLNARFDSATQNRLFDYLIDVKRPEIGAYINGKSNDKRTAIQQLAREFASVGLEYPEAGRGRGQSRYAGTGGNRASISPETAAAALDGQRKGGQATIQAQATPRPTQITPRPAQPSTQIVQVPPGNINPTIGDRLGAGRGHGGVDLQVENGTPLRAISDGIIVDSDYEKGWGNFLVMKDNRGIYHLYGHMQSGYKKRGPVKKGEVIGKVGMTGRTSGPHLHWETGTGWNGGVITGRFDALSMYSKYAPFNTSPTTGDPGQPAQIAAPTPAQITPSGTQQRRQASQQLAQQPAGPSIIIIEEEPPAPQPQGSIGGGGAMMIPIIINPLNSFITKKLLLDLAYT